MVDGHTDRQAGICVYRVASLLISYGNYVLIMLFCLEYFHWVMLELRDMNARHRWNAYDYIVSIYSYLSIEMCICPSIYLSSTITICLSIYLHLFIPIHLLIF